MLTEEGYKLILEKLPLINNRSVTPLDFNSSALSMNPGTCFMLNKQKRKINTSTQNFKTYTYSNQSPISGTCVQVYQKTSQFLSFFQILRNQTLVKSKWKIKSSRNEECYLLYLRQRETRLMNPDFSFSLQTHTRKAKSASVYSLDLINPTPQSVSIVKSSINLYKKNKKEK